MTGDSATRRCSSCGAEAQAAARFCSQCGKALDGDAQAQAPIGKWYHNVWFALFLLFFVLGPFGIPLVWTNPRLARGVKIALTVVTLLYTVWLVDVTVRAV